MKIGKTKLKLLLALLLGPFAFFTAYTTVVILLSVFDNFFISIPFAVGFLGYFALDILVYRPVQSYTTAHEITHAVAARLSGFKVQEISINDDSGYVKTDGLNAFTALAPYVIPLYSIISAIFFTILLFKWDTKPVKYLAVGTIAFFIGFHILNTFRSIYQARQTDLRQAGGVMFSLMIILLSNSIILILSLKFFYPELVSITAMLKNIFDKTLLFWVFLGKSAVYLFNLLRELIKT